MRIEFPWRGRGLGGNGLAGTGVLNNLLRFVVRTTATAVGLWVATAVISGITLSGESGWGNALTLFAVAVIFGIVNAVIKPLIHVLGCLVYLVTLWLIAFVVNALLFLLVGWLAQVVHLPFAVHGFWSGFWGAIIVSVVSWAINVVLPDPEPRRYDLPS